MIKAYFHEQRGAAALEFALMLGLFTISLPSVVDLGVYAYQNMQVKNSAQMGVQAVWAACAQFPVTSSCSGAQAALNAAVQQTSLNSAVTVTSATEGYYCTNASGALQQVGNSGTFTSGQDLNSRNPTTPSCPSGSLTSSASDYMTVQVTFTYTPVFAQASVAGLLGTTITGSAQMRLL